MKFSDLQLLIVNEWNANGVPDTTGGRGSGWKRLRLPVRKGERTIRTMVERLLPGAFFMVRSTSCPLHNDIREIGDK